VTINQPAPPPVHRPPAIIQQQGSTTTTIEGKVTTTFNWGSAGVGPSPTIFPTAMQLQQQQALQQQQQQPPQPQQEQWYSNWWNPASSWHGDSSSGWNHSHWHQPAPKAASKPAVKGAKSAGKGKAAPPPEAPPPSGPSPALSPPQEPDPLDAQLAAAAATAHLDRNNWMWNMLPLLRSLEDFSMLEVFFEGNCIEIWSISSITRQRTKRYSYRLNVVLYLQGYSPILHRGESRGLAKMLDQDCEEVIDVPSSPWHGYTFEQAAQHVADACDTLVDMQAISGMQRPQIHFRLYLTVRRQLLEFLYMIKEKCD